MYVYIIGFITSCIFLKMADNVRKYRYVFFIFTCFGLMIPCIIAGVRAENIGTDVTVYVKPMVEAAKRTDSIMDFLKERWFVIWRYKYVYEFEWGYILLVYIVSKIFKSLGGVLFFIQALIIIPVYMGLYQCRKKQPIWLGMLVFYLMFYNASLNMMRQWIAMALLFWGFQFLISKKNKNFFILYILAILFHTSALIGIVFWPVHKYLDSDKGTTIKLNENIKFKQLFKVIKLVAAGCICLLGINIIAYFLNFVGLTKFVGYIDGDLYLLGNQILLRLPILLLVHFNWKQMNNRNALTPFYITMIWFDLLASQLSSINAYAFRIATFFSMFNILSFPILCKAPKKQVTRWIMTISVVIYMFIYWYYYYVVQGSHMTIPYETAFK